MENPPICRCMSYWKRWIFHCYVSLPEGMQFQNLRFHPKTTQIVLASHFIPPKNQWVQIYGPRLVDVSMAQCNWFQGGFLLDVQMRILEIPIWPKIEDLPCHYWWGIPYTLLYLFNTTSINDPYYLLAVYIWLGIFLRLFQHTFGTHP